MIELINIYLFKVSQYNNSELCELFESSPFVPIGIDAISDSSSRTDEPNRSSVDLEKLGWKLVTYS